MNSSINQTLTLLRLVRSNNLGPVGIKKLLSGYSDIQDAIYALQSNPSLLGRKVELADISVAEQEYEKGQRFKAHAVTILDEDYPLALKQCHDAPPFFWLLGNRGILAFSACAIIGSRNSSVGGRKIAYSLGQALANEQFTTVSGMARGIDGSAHEGGLKQTIAVLGGGVDKIYPPEHKNLYFQIIENNGAIISENPIGTEPKSNLFLRRNRIISGLSAAIVVVEAGKKSGSLATADFALSQNREVFAVPGSPLDGRALGTNYLLRNGASWAESSEDVLSYMRDSQKGMVSTVKKQELADNLKISLQKKSNTIKLEDTPILNTSEKCKGNFLDYFSSVPIQIDDIIRLSGKTANEVMMLVTEHEFLGDIERQAGNMFILIPQKAA